MPVSPGSRTAANLKAAFAMEAMAHRRYVYFALKAEVQGRADIAAMFRESAEGEAGHAAGHLQFLEEAGRDPATDLPFRTLKQALDSAVAGENQESGMSYPAMAKVAREEGFHEVADWFETLGVAERQHVMRFNKALEALGEG